MKRLLAVAICLPAFLGLAYASPITLFDSIDGSTNFNLNGIVKTTGSAPYTGLYASFSTSASPFDLQSVELALADKAAPTTGGFTIDLVADSSTTPGGAVGRDCHGARHLPHNLADRLHFCHEYRSRA